jgi:hypothetical protein
MIKTSNSNARALVKKCQAFKANNLWAEWVDSMGVPNARYVVYSYDRHWPLFVYDVMTEMWFENASKFGVTTSKHKTQSHPHAATTHLHVEDMIKVASDGAVGLITPIN